jgi:hypothetical protein
MLFLVLLACARRSAPPQEYDSTDTSVDSEDSAPPEASPGVWRIGPPAPSVGIYGLAAHPEGREIYVSNLHVPWITVVDPTTGGWAGSIPLGVDSPSFPVLAVTERTLWATAFNLAEVLRYDVDTHAALAPVVPEAPPVAITPAASGGLWIGLADASAVRYTDDVALEQVALPVVPSALASSSTGLAFLSADTHTVGFIGSVGSWSATVDADTLNSVAVLDGTVYVTERSSGDVIALRDGGVIGRVHAGSDTFTVVADGDHLLVTNRQGAALPASGAYEGAPGQVIALSPSLEQLWATDFDRTVHFIALSGDHGWVANEDALHLSAFDRQTGAVVVSGPPVGLTLDSFAVYDGTLWFPSHLTDELWSLEGAQLETCGWPLVAVPTDDDLWFPCQMTGELGHVRGAPEPVASTFQTDCGDDALCTSHDLLLDATLHDGELWYSDPYDQTVRSASGARFALSPVAEEAEHAQHMALASVGGTLYAFEPRDQKIYALTDGALNPVTTVSGGTADFALVADEDRLWAGAASLDGQRVRGIVQAAGDGVVLALDGWDLIAYDRETLIEVGRRDLSTLRVPLSPSPMGDPRPVRLKVDGGVVWVANVMRGTVERLALPGLDLMGTDEVRAVGRWSGPG